MIIDFQINCQKWKIRFPHIYFSLGIINSYRENVKRSKLSFLDKTILNSANAVKSIYLQAENAAKENFIQKINPHVKLISLIYLAIVISCQ